MNKSESISKIATALVAAQKSIGAAEKTSTNKHFNFDYATLADVIAACKVALVDNGITVIQTIEGAESPILETILLHESGEFLSSTMKIIVAKPNDPQALGSGITYARRYALQSMVFVPSVDDDAEWAKRAEKGRPTPETTETVKEKVKKLGGEVIEPEPDKPQRWQDVECHKGLANGPILGKKLGEMPEKVFKHLVTKHLPFFDMKNPKDKSLADAIAEAQADKAKGDQIPGLETPASVSENDTGTDTPPKEESEPQTPPEPKDWRSVKIHFGAKRILGKTLGELSKDDLLNCYIYGIPRTKTKEGDDLAFINGVSEAAIELELNKVQDNVNRREVVELQVRSGATPDQFEKALIGCEILKPKERFATCDSKTVDYILKNWELVEKILKGEQ